MQIQSKPVLFGQKLGEAMTINPNSAIHYTDEAKAVRSTLASMSEMEVDDNVTLEWQKDNGWGNAYENILIRYGNLGSEYLSRAKVKTGWFKSEPESYADYIQRALDTIKTKIDLLDFSQTPPEDDIL